jgi:hypothetical protein
MRRSIWLSFLLAVATTCALAQPSSAITETQAREIAFKEAGCSAAMECVVKGGFRDGKWVFIVSFIHSRDAKGEPQFMPGGHMGITVGPNGEVLNRMPGA